METNFFRKIASLGLKGDLQLTIANGAEGCYIVSARLNNEQCGDDAKNLIPAFNVRGTAEELDGGFFAKITEPMQAASGLIANMDTFMKQLEEAKKQSAMEKETAERERKAKEEKDRKYRDAMQKADELEKEGRYRDAWMKVPDPTEYPEHAETIRSRKGELSAKFSAPSLFGA